MWTWGMAMATQQATPATHSSNCAEPGARPKGAGRHRRGQWWRRSCSGGRARMSRARLHMMRLITPMPM
jgi:hypothetical protein